MSNENSSNKIALAVAVITSITSLAVAVITGYFGLQAVKMQQKAESTSAAVQVIATDAGSTQIALQDIVDAPTLTPYPTYTPYPTIAPAPLPTTAIILPVIEPTSISDQQLPVGRGYQGNGFRVILNEMWMNVDISFYFEVYNDRTSSLNFSTIYSYAHLYDDLGNEYRITTIGSNDTNQYNISSGSFKRIGNFGQLNFAGPIASNAHYLIFEYEQLLGLNKLTWQIPINQ